MEIKNALWIIGTIVGFFEALYLYNKHTTSKSGLSFKELNALHEQAMKDWENDN